MILLTLLALLAGKPIPSTPPAPPAPPAPQAAAPSPSPSPSTPTLSKGDVAPQFVLNADDGTLFNLSSFLLSNKKTVVLVFFPKAFTGG